MIQISRLTYRQLVGRMTRIRLENHPSRNKPSIGNLDLESAEMDLRHLLRAAKSHEQLSSYIKSYSESKPLSLILGSQPFCSLDIKVRSPILSPRPETEEWVGHLMLHYDLAGKSVLEVGFGSGCIGLALARKFPTVKVTAVDSSPEAFRLASENKAGLGLSNISLFCESFQEHRGGPYDLIVSNPPYIPMNRHLPKSVRWYEDPQALYSGPDGLDLIRGLIGSRKQLLCPNTDGLQMVFEFDGSLRQRLLLRSLVPSFQFRRDQYGYYRTAWLSSEQHHVNDPDKKDRIS